MPQKVKPLSRRSFLEKKPEAFSLSSPKPTFCSSSFRSEKCAFALTPVKNKPSEQSKKITKSSSPSDSEDSETDFEDNDMKEEKILPKNPPSSCESNPVENVSTKIQSSCNKLMYVELKALENDIVKKYCALSFESNCNQDNREHLSSEQNKQLYSYLEEQVLEDYKLALKLQEELDKENVADTQQVKKNYELRKRSRVSESSIIKHSNKKTKLVHPSPSASKQRTIEEAFQLKSV